MPKATTIKKPSKTSKKEVSQTKTKAKKPSEKIQKKNVKEVKKVVKKETKKEEKKIPKKESKKTSKIKTESNVAKKATKKTETVEKQEILESNKETSKEEVLTLSENQENNESDKKKKEETPDIFQIEAKKLETIIDISMQANYKNDYEERLLQAFDKSYKNFKKEVGKKRAEELLEGLKTESLLDNYDGDKDDKVNEALVMIVQDESTPEDIREKTIMKLIRRNIGMIHRNVNIFQSRINGKDDGKMSNEDLQQEAQLAFIRAINTYKIERGEDLNRTKFSSYCYRVINNAFNSLFTDKINKRRKYETSLDANVTNDSDGKETTLADFVPDRHDTPEEIAMNDSRGKLIREVLKTLTPDQRFLAYSRFGLITSEKITQVDIADFLEVSQANISKAETVMLAALKTAFEKIGLTSADLLKDYKKY